MIVVDTSVWVEYLRGTTHPAAIELDRLIDEDDLAVTEVVRMEVLAGATSARAERLLRSRLERLPVLPLLGAGDFDEAARLWRRCRRGGETIRSMLDCLIAVPTIRADAPLLHRDSDFDVLARHSDLQIHSWR